MSWPRRFTTERLTLVLRDEEPNETYDYALFDHAGAHLGDVAVHAINLAGRVAELGYELRPEHRGRGYAAEAARVLIDHLGRAGFTRVEIRCATENAPSAALARRLGFTFEARARETNTLVFTKSI